MAPTTSKPSQTSKHNSPLTNETPEAIDTMEFAKDRALERSIGKWAPSVCGRGAEDKQSRQIPDENPRNHGPIHLQYQREVLHAHDSHRWLLRSNADIEDSESREDCRWIYDPREKLVRLLVQDGWARRYFGCHREGLLLSATRQSRYLPSGGRSWSTCDNIQGQSWPKYPEWIPITRWRFIPPGNRQKRCCGSLLNLSRRRAEGNECDIHEQRFNSEAPEA